MRSSNETAGGHDRLGATAAWSLPARAQQSAKIHRIGYLTPGSSTNDLGRRNIDALRQGLNELGYLAGQNIAIEYRFAEGDFDRLPKLAAELVRLDVAIIVAGPTPAAVAARKETPTIPIVMIDVVDPVGLGLIESLARPGGNVTGLAFTVGTETFGKGLEHLKEAVPDLHRVAVLFNPANPAHALVPRDLQAAARATGVELRPVEARVPDDFDRAFSLMAEQRVGGLYVIPDVLFIVHARRLAVLATGHRFPSLHQFREEVEAGGLMS
jgi:putative tryptophan/tyrosine transport system substrate-binding protein